MNISPDVVVNIRGRHAVGKSEAVAQFAQEVNLPLIMRRISQMTEGDMLGLPKVSDKGTSFTMCEWFIEACNKPVVLFLDERNRGLDQVKQSIFELCDSRGLYGHKLHPGTYVIIAENVGASYQVQSCDPAEISRSATVQLEPSFQEWIDYAQDKANPATIEFVRSEGVKVLEFVTDGAHEPDKKYADRRSWMRLDAELSRPRDNLQGKSLFEVGDESQIATLVCAFLGVEVGLKFAKFLREREKAVSAKDILSDWTKAKSRLSSNGKNDISQQAYIELGNKIHDHLGDKKKLTEKTKENLIAFMKDMPGEASLALLAQLTSDNISIVGQIAAEMGPYLAHIVQGDMERKKVAEAAKS